MDMNAFVSALTSSLNSAIQAGAPTESFAIKVKIGEEKYHSAGKIETVDELLANYIAANKSWMRTNRNNILVYRTKHKDIITMKMYAETIQKSVATTYVQHIKPSIALPFVMPRFTAEELDKKGWLPGMTQAEMQGKTWTQMCSWYEQSIHNQMTCNVHVV